MKTICELISEKLAAAFTACGYAAGLGRAAASDRPDLCQFQCSGAFAAAKQYKKSPAAIAGAVADRLQDGEMFARVSVMGGGFINMDLADGWLLQYMAGMLADPHLGIAQSPKKETVFLDYGGPNVAKPLHVGHLRSAIIGEALKRLAAATGRKTISDVHLGDWGLQMGLVMAQLQESGGPAALSAEEWGTLYPAASQRSRQDAAFYRKAQQLTACLQAGEEPYRTLWRQIMARSLPEIQAVYRLLDVYFDLWHGESDAAQYTDALLQRLQSRQLLQSSQGAQVVEVSCPQDDPPLPPVIVQKSDGAGGYAATDLAALLERQTLYQPDELWYVVDNRQSLHFTQVFRCARAAELVPPTTVLRHLGFGTMNGPDGRPYKTRDGGVMPLQQLYQAVYGAIWPRVAASAFAEETDRKQVAHRLTVAALKFGDLINHRTKNYVFDIEKFTASEGKTGVFLLYTLARIYSLQKKAGMVQPRGAAGIHTDSERALWLLLARSNEAFALAYAEKAPNILCENVWRIAASFSRFYSENHILTQPDAAVRADWLCLCGAVRAVMEKHLQVLGIRPVPAL